MIDLIYVLVMLAFFGLMVAYVAGCEKLGRAPSNGEKGSGESP